jgi:hypothetical protein
VGPRAVLDDVEKRKLLILSGLELRPLGRPARSQSLYRLRYPGSYSNLHTFHLWRSARDVAFMLETSSFFIIFF